MSQHQARRVCCAAGVTGGTQPSGTNVKCTHILRRMPGAFGSSLGVMIAMPPPITMAG